MMPLTPKLSGRYKRCEQIRPSRIWGPVALIVVFVVLILILLLMPPLG
jgi:hypothetical protein